MEYTDSINAARTTRCIEKIKTYKRGGASMILLVGKAGVGKSSLAEHITGVSGLSGASERGTERCQIIDTQIDETEYFILDTPGFEDERNAWATFNEIAQVLDQIREHVVIVGIFFVTPINVFKRRSDPFEEKLYVWLFGMSGKPYMPSLTFVTTFWEVHSTAQRDKYNKFLARQRDSEWATFITHGARTYQFGKVYSGGTDTEACLHWETDTEQLTVQVREMVRVHCADRPTDPPLILHELNMGLAHEFTAAAQVFRPAGHEAKNGPGPSAPQPTASSEPSSGSRPTSAESQGSGGQPSPHPPPAQSTNNPPPPASGWETLGGFILAIAKSEGPKIAQYLLQRQIGGGGAFAGGAGVASWAGGLQSMSSRGLDTNSVMDTAKFFGVGSDMASRGQLFDTWGGIGDYIGSVEQNEWLRRQMWQRFWR